MAREITVTNGLNIRKVDPDGVSVSIFKVYQGTIVDTMTGAKGPTPGALTAAVRGSGGTQVSFSALTRPGWCWLEHLGRDDESASEDGDYVDIGLYDPVTHKFYPMLELRPNWKLPVPLSRNIQESFLGPGTGSAGLGETTRLMLIGYPVAQRISVEAYQV